MQTNNNKSFTVFNRQRYLDINTTQKIDMLTCLYATKSVCARSLARRKIVTRSSQTKRVTQESEREQASGTEKNVQCVLREYSKCNTSNRFTARSTIYWERMTWAAPKIETSTDCSMGAHELEIIKITFYFYSTILCRVIDCIDCLSLLLNGLIAHAAFFPLKKKFAKLFIRQIKVDHMFYWYKIPGPIGANEWCPLSWWHDAYVQWSLFCSSQISS